MVLMGDIVNLMTIGVLISSEFDQHFHWNEFNNTVVAHGHKLNKIDILKPLEEQPYFDVLFHKIPDIIAAADQGNDEAKVLVENIENYLSNHPRVIVINEFDKFRVLLNRTTFYTLLDTETFLTQDFFTPKFAHFISNDTKENQNLMKQRGVTYPVICKTSVADGPPFAHDMIIIFGENSLSECTADSVVQSYVNHNGVLHKVSVIGNRFHLAQRSSLGNLNASDDLKPLFYKTNQISRPRNHSPLSKLVFKDKSMAKLPLNMSQVQTIIQVLRKRLGLMLFGFDLVIENVSGRHAVIDINVFNYVNFPNFFDHLLEYIDDSNLSRDTETLQLVT